jgi:HAD superfamily hydrolase (TIGR01490 family)
MGTISSEDRNKGNTHIAFFDLDRTITKAISGIALACGAYRKGLMSRSNLINAIYLSISYKLKLKNPVRIMNDMILWVKGLDEKTFTKLCSDVFHEVLQPSIYPDAISEIEMHKRNNVKTVILSSSLVKICRETANYLQMDDIVCSELEISDGHLTGSPKGRLCFGREKINRLTEYCERNNSTPDLAWYYGDSVSDLPVLSIVGNPVCVNPDNKLRKEAAKRKWKILLWNNTENLNH